ncbi:MAG: PQQ-dependent dehydrogenase, methanol/ethanol family [Gammaproteobacteria bacterium]|nr:PQQ-dependent dehydrogenase, methanol/ethanol family [Gammaproteobacteria bacterium]
MKAFSILIAVVLLAALAWFVTRQAEAPPPTADVEEPAVVPAPSIGMVDDARIENALVDEPGSWMAHGIDFTERRFSPLTQINRDNVSDLGLVWRKDLGTFHAQEATPLVVDGLMIFPSAWNIVYALDAVTGETRWVYDPKVDRGRIGTIWAPFSRGIAIYKGRVYVATIDGYLAAVDAATGQEVWKIDTIVDRAIPYFISGAPRVGGGHVYIGNGGSEWGTRGYTTAYDAETGEQVWRFWSVPGDPSLPFEHPEMEMAAKTWKGGEWWKYGGGGNVWNSIVYDAELNQVYLGMGNAAPWARVIRSPGGGDNLFAAAIVAVDADTGRMNWYYQTTPGDNWDFTAVQDMALVDLEVDGAMRKVILQAPKNGFFYVIDRTNGELLRAHPFATVTWASHVDMETGRPVELEQGNYNDEAKWVLPGPLGAHNWQAMSVDPGTGVVYMSTHDYAWWYKIDPSFQETGIYKWQVGQMNLGLDPETADLLEGVTSPAAEGYLTAFDPLTGDVKWQNELDHHWNGGVVATAGGLVFQGEGMGHIYAYDKDNGERLWGFNTYTSIIAPPITYQIDDTQFVAIITGSGGAESFIGKAADTATDTYGNHPQMLVFALGGTEQLEEPDKVAQIPPEQPLLSTERHELRRGSVLYHDFCAACHGGQAKSFGVVPDLRFMEASVREIFDQIVLGGALEPVGMGSFAEWLSEADAKRVLGYILYRANADRDKALMEGETEEQAGP